MTPGACQGCGAELLLSKTRPRKWCSGRCRKASYGDPCVECGARTSYGAEHARVPEPRCEECEREGRQSRANLRLLRICALRAAGLLNYQIAEKLGMTPASVASAVKRARDRGVDVPRTAYGPAAARATR